MNRRVATRGFESAGTPLDRNAERGGRHFSPAARGRAVEGRDASRVPGVGAGPGAAEGPSVGVNPGANLKSLNRAELLHILVMQAKEIERLEDELAQAHRQLADRSIAIRNAGTLAEAALHLNGVFEAADRAVAQYVENIAARSRNEGFSWP